MTGETPSLGSGLLHAKASDLAPSPSARLDDVDQSALPSMQDLLNDPDNDFDTDDDELQEWSGDSEEEWGQPIRPEDEDWEIAEKGRVPQTRHYSTLTLL